MRKIILTLILIALSYPAFASDVVVEWDAVTDPACAGYIVEYSVDNGQTWVDGPLVTDPNILTATVTAVPDDVLVLLRVSSLNANGDKFPRRWAGAWFDGRLKPLQVPTGASIP